MEIGVKLANEDKELITSILCICVPDEQSSHFSFIFSMHASWTVLVRQSNEAEQ